MFIPQDPRAKRTLSLDEVIDKIHSNASAAKEAAERTEAARVEQAKREQDAKAAMLKAVDTTVIPVLEKFVSRMQAYDATLDRARDERSLGVTDLSGRKTEASVAHLASVQFRHPTVERNGCVIMITRRNSTFAHAYVGRAFGGMVDYKSHGDLSLSDLELPRFEALFAEMVNSLG